MKLNMDQKQTVEDSRIRYITKARIPQKRKAWGIHQVQAGERWWTHLCKLTDVSLRTGLLLWCGWCGTCRVNRIPELKDQWGEGALETWRGGYRPTDAKGSQLREPGIKCRTFLSYPLISWCCSAPRPHPVGNHRAGAGFCLPRQSRMEEGGWWEVEGEEGNRHHPATQLDSLHIVQGKLATHWVKIKSYSLTPYFLPQNKF